MATIGRDVLSIEEQVQGMGEHAARMLHDGVAALAALDRDLAANVIARNQALAQMDEDIEARILSTLTLKAPVASDLRRIGASLKLITYINRVGRYGYDVARATADWPEGRDHVAKMVNLREMAQKVESMLAMVLEAFSAHGVPDLGSFMALEDDVDALRFSVFRECLTYMAQDPHNIEPCAHYMMVARYLERCGDNVCKMVEKLHYAHTGERLLLH